MSSLKVLIVEDYESFRRFIRTTLLKRPELQIVGEASDGLQAVKKAEKLQPDLILLDIGLPTLNGIEAARQIRKLSPESKIIFLSQESSAGVVQEAISLGALGYVVKTQAGSDLLAAVKSVLQGRQFVSVDSISNNPIEVAPPGPSFAYASKDVAGSDATPLLEGQDRRNRNSSRELALGK
jgi:DNA-binding NarL/FixJ family response regulator